jgi:hypothetical protein
MNVSSQPKTLYEGTVIAKISPVSEIASPVSGKIHSKTEFPPYLKDLFEQSPWQKYAKMSAKDVLLLNPVPGTDPGLIAQTNLLNREEIRFCYVFFLTLD